MSVNFTEERRDIMDNKKKSMTILVIGVLALLLVVGGATFAYFAATSGAPASTDITITTNTVDMLSFETGGAISISADQSDFGAGNSNKVGSSFAKVTLRANNKTNTATGHYYLYLNIEENTFEYTTLSHKAELMLTVTDGENNIVAITGLPEVLDEDDNVIGYDITEEEGLITILNNRTITSTGTKIENWNVTITLINLDTNQNNNAGKTLNATLAIQEGEALFKHIQGLFTSNGVNGLYLHDENLTNGANDGSLRYAGGNHDAIGTCTYNGETLTDIEESDCQKVYVAKTVGETNNVYTTMNTLYNRWGKIYKTDKTPVWDSTNEVCTFTNVVGSDKLYDYNVTAPNEVTCTGDVYTDGLGNYFVGITLAGSGTFTQTEAEARINNYVCFGTDDLVCPEDNLYRIIGVFDNKVKLIKETEARSNLLGTNGDYYEEYNEPGTLYYWNKQNFDLAHNETGYYYHVWSYSELNTVNLNTNYLNNIGDEWSNKIAETTWYVNSGTYAQIYYGTVNSAYNAELGEAAKNATGTFAPYNAKVGLMYVSDYGYAAYPTAWTTDLVTYNNSNTVKNNWMYIRNYEWTISRIADFSHYAFYVSSDGGVNYIDIKNFMYAIRPSFNLKSLISYAGGTGSASDPFRIK